MKHIVKTVSRYLLLSLTLGCSFFAIKSNTNSWTANYAASEPSAPTKQNKAYTEADFADEVEADPEELSVSLIQSTTTSTSQFLNFAFKSKTLVGFTTAKNDFIVNITDLAFTGEINNPVSEDYDNRDEAGLPILEGEIVFITGSSSVDKNGVKELYIPSTLTRDGAFVVNVNAIAPNCITVDGSEYRGKNSWYEGSALKFSKLYIPETITTIYANAITGTPDDVTIYYEGSSIPSGFAANWTDANNIQTGVYGKDSNKTRKVGNNVTDMEDEHGRPVDFSLGCKQDGKNNVGEQYDRPLVVQYDKVKMDNGVEVARETIFEELELTNTTGTPYDSVGNISDLTYSRSLSYKLEPNETIDDNSVVFHNIMKFVKGSVNIDTSKRYFAKPRITYSEKMDLSRLVTFKAGSNSTFAGYSMFSLTMDKNLSITSEKYPEAHSLYLDVKSDFYQQNLTKIEAGLTEIRYSLYNLYSASYHFVYEGSGGELKEVNIPITSIVTYQTLNSDKGNKVSILLRNKDVAPDFSANKVRTFELMNITIQMDLLTTSDSGSKSVLAKSQVSYKFGCITVRNNEKLSVFNWNVFLVIFCAIYIALFTAGAFALYKVKKEKYKNDEFKRVNDKRYLKSSLMYGAGFLVIAYAIIFVVMRAGGFANTIVSFNPTDPLLIAFSVAGLIIGGYFIVLAIKAVKAERERQRAIRLKLNEDVDDDGTK